jgi:hypothetical protein
MLGGAGMKKKSHIFVRRMVQEIPQMGRLQNASKQGIYYTIHVVQRQNNLLPLPPPPLLSLFSACVARLGSRLLARLTLLGWRQHQGQAAEASACTARLWLRAKMGGGSGACFARLALGSGR